MSTKRVERLKAELARIKAIPPSRAKVKAYSCADCNTPCWMTPTEAKRRQTIRCRVCQRRVGGFISR